MTIDELLQTLQEKEIQIGLHQEKLKVIDQHNRLTPELLSILKGHRKQLLRLLQEGEGYTKSDFPYATLSSDLIAELQKEHPYLQNLYISTPMQQGMLFHGLLDGQGESYTTQQYCDLYIALDQALFMEAWKYIVQQYDIFRTCFVGFDQEQVHQLVESQVLLPLTCLDWQNVPQSIQQEKLQVFRGQDRRQGFDFEQAPLMRITLIQFSKHHYHLLWSHHHSLTDGWSNAQVLAEMLTYYQNRQLNQEIEQQGIIPYANYIHWLFNKDQQQAEHYWQSQLQRIDSVNILPIQRVSQGSQLPHYERISFHLHEDIVQAMQQIVRQSGTTLNTLVQLAWSYLLYRYSNESHVLFGSTVSGRPAELEGVEQIVGLFINTLPVIVEFLPEHSIEFYLHHIHQQSAKQNEFAYFSLAQIYKAAQKQGILSQQQDLFESVLVFENYPIADKVRHQLGLDIQHFSSDEYTNYPITLLVNIEPQLEFTLSFNTRLYDTQIAERLMDHFKQIILSLTEQPLSTAMVTVPIMTKEEYTHQCKQWLRPKVEISVTDSLIDRFYAQVLIQPYEIAVADQELELTYEQLNQRSNQVARKLMSIGVKSNNFVGLCSTRQVEMIIGILGILKAGAAYVPLDPKYPKQRLNYLISDSGIAWVVTARVEPLSVLDGLIKIDLHDPALQQFSQYNLTMNEVQYDCNNLAYLIYTSGSTGRPKGVMITHRQVVRLFDVTSPLFYFSRKDVWSVFHSFAFDFSVWEIWGGLLSGGKIIIIPYDISRDTEAFTQFIIQKQITILNQTPSAFYLLAEHLSSHTTEHVLRYVIFGGEALDTNKLHYWYQHHGERVQLINMYGITEITVHGTFYAIQPQSLLTQQKCIGEPLDDLTMIVCDKQLQLQPPDLPGELLVSGGGVATGYWQQEKLTGQRFIDFNIDNIVRRYYRTGDLVKRNIEGKIHYLGRIDNQVKIRGYRIELGEIDLALTQYSTIEHATTLIQFLPDATLVSYIVLRHSSTSQYELQQQIKQFLGKSLPEFMIPTFYIVIDEIPMTLNGKVDKKQLPIPDLQHLEKENYIAPTNEVEQCLCEVWQKTLGIQLVGIEDNYFSLGGDSIKSIRLVAIAKQQGLAFSVSDLFRYSTVKQLAVYLQRQERQCVCQQPQNGLVEPQKSALSPFALLTAEEKKYFQPQYADVYPLCELQAGMVYHSQMQPDSAIYHDVFCYHLRGQWHEYHFRQSVQKLITQHEILRTSFHFNGDRPLQCIHQEVILPLVIEDLTHLEPKKQQEIIDNWHFNERFQHFEWDHAPLFRIMIFLRNQYEFQYGFSFYHGILDGWSVATFHQQLFSYYNQSVNGQQAEVTSLKPFYREYIALELQTINSKEIKNYWRDYLADAVVSYLPRRHDEQEENPHNGCQTHLVNDFSPLSTQLIPLARQLAIPIHHLLLSIHVKVLALLFNEQDVLTCIVQNCRLEQAGGEHMLGLFLNSLPFRTQVGTMSWRQLIEQVHEQLTMNYPYRRYPLSQIQHDTHLDFSETVFNYTHFHTYNDLLTENGLQVLSGNTFEQTNFKLAANFNRQIKSDDIHLSLLFDPNKVDASLIQKYAGYYSKAARSLIKHLEGDHNSVSLLGVREQQWLIYQCNQTEETVYSQRGIQELFSEQAIKTPNALALRFAENNYSYRDVEQWTNQLARYFYEQGISFNTVVGVSLERSEYMIVYLLAILKAGAAYVPLDPQYPKQRLAYMVQDAELALLITETQFLTQFEPNYCAIHCIDDAKSLQRITAYANTPLTLERIINGYDLAYIIFTSGTTGAPKGVRLSHRGAVNLAYSQQKLFHLTERARVLHYASLSFDAATWEWVMALSIGASLIVCPENYRKSPQELAKFIEQERISHATIPPAMLPLLPLHENYALEGIFLGGEACDPNVAKEWAVHYPVYNVYGPTESTICATWQRIEPEKDIHIGSPLPNIQTYVLGEQQELLPTGTAGELYIGGIGLALGYTNHSDLSATAFIPNRFSRYPGRRLYRTGDKVIRYEDGSLHFLGRIDDQVKVRGFRIELAEIAKQLRKESVVKNIVVVTQTIHEQTQIVAYVVLHEMNLIKQPDQTIHRQLIQNLHRRIKSELPEYMYPYAYVVVDYFPTTANGKIDFKQLPVPQIDDLIKSAYVEPSTPIEKRLCIIWQELLGIDKIGLYDNFFELGGHSLLAIKLVAQINRYFNTQLQIGDLLSAVTIASLALLVDEGHDTVNDWLAIKPLAVPEIIQNRSLFLIPGMGVTAVAYQNFASALAHNINLYALESKGLDGLVTPYTQLNELIEHHIQTILSIQKQDCFWLAGHSFGGAVAFEIARRLEEKGHQTVVFLLDSSLYLQEKVELTTISHYLEYELYPKLMTNEAIGQQDHGIWSNLFRGATAVAKAQIPMYNQYFPSGSIQGKVYLYFAEEGSMCHNTEQVQHNVQSFCLQPVISQVVPGDHHSMFHTAKVSALALSIVEHIIGCPKSIK